MRYHRLSLVVPLFLTAAVYAQSEFDRPDFWLHHAQSDAANLPNPAERAGVLTSIAVQWQSIPDAAASAVAFNDAASAAAQIPDPQARFRADLALAGFADEYLDPATAQRAVAGAQADLAHLPEGPAKNAAQNDLANLHHVLDGFAAARVQIAAEPDPAKRAQEYAGLAMAFAQGGPRHHDDCLGAVAAASESLRQVADPNAVGAIQPLIVQAQCQAGDVDQAAATAKTILQPPAQADAWTTLADAYIRQNRATEAADAVARLTTAAMGCPDDRKAAVFLNIARAHDAMNDKPGALAEVDRAVKAAGRLEAADRADALSAASRLRADLGDTAGAAVLTGDAASAARTVGDPEDLCEIWMSIAAAQARAGLGDAAKQSIANAQAAAPNIPQDKRHPDGDPPHAAYLDVIRSAAQAGDFNTAQAISAQVNDPRLNHDAVLAIADQQINLAQYQAAEDLVQKEGSIDSEAAVCGMIAASLARTRTAADAEHWIGRLHNLSDKVAARLAVAEVQAAKTHP